MKVVILAGGLGTRLAEETEVKPMVEIGGCPVLWHIMKIYAQHGFEEFFIALGYNGEFIKRYFLDYFNLNGDMSIRLAAGHVERHGNKCEDWNIHLVETGLETQIGGRLKRLQPCLQYETFMITYGDGVSNVDLNALLGFHRSRGKIAIDQLKFISTT